MGSLDKARDFSNLERGMAVLIYIIRTKSQDQDQEAQI